MQSIGEFAQFSGLTVKALRFYDEKGLLPPAEMDSATGYRYYHPSQLRQAAIIGVLRAMEVPVTTVSEVLANPDRRDEILSVFEQARAQERARQDRNFAEGTRLLAGYDAELSVQTRTAAAQPWVGVWLTLDLTELDAGDLDDDEETFMAPMRALTASLKKSRVRLTGGSWSQFAADDRS